MKKDSIKTKPTALYIHGLGSGSRSTTTRIVCKIMPAYKWIAVEVGEDMEEAVRKIDGYVMEHNPKLVMGTSLGGLYVMYINAPDAIKVICNPAINIDEIIPEKIGFGEHEYFVEREDGKQTFILDETVCEKFRTYRAENEMMKGIENYAVFSAHDELIGDTASLNNMAVAFNAGYRILIEAQGKHRLQKHTIRFIDQKLRDLSFRHHMLSPIIFREYDIYDILP